MGNKQNRAPSLSGTYFADLFNLTTHVEDYLIGGVVSGEGVDSFDGDYISASAIALADYANLPKYSVIRDHQAHKTYYKTGAAGVNQWYYDAWTIVT